MGRRLTRKWGGILMRLRERYCPRDWWPSGLCLGRRFGGTARGEWQ